MDAAHCSETTRLLRAWTNGDPGALDALTPRMYEDLRRIAGSFMRHENAGGTIQTTALVHEAYLKLVDLSGIDCGHRKQFFALCAQIMRRILLDRARRRLAAKRGGAGLRVEFSEAAPDSAAERAIEVVRLDDALDALAKMDARKAEVIQLRFFAGLSVQETAQFLEVSEDTVLRDWRLARSWLLKELGGE